MKIVVDYDECEANAVCVGILPEIFEVDDEDNLIIHSSEVPDGLAGRVRHAVR